MKWLARYRLKQAINFHMRVAETLWYIKDQGICSGSNHHEHYINDMGHRGNCECRCARRIEKLLLTKYN